MLKFYKNKSQTFKCKVDVQGTDNPKVKPRLILVSKKGTPNVFFEGKYEDGQCEIDILSTANIGADKGEVILEIIANNTVFTPWTSKYEILSEQIIVENVGNVELISTTPEIDVKIKKEIVEHIVKPQKKEKNIFKSKVSNKIIKEVYEYVNMTKKIKNKKGRVKLLKEIVTFYKPNRAIRKWATNIFTDINEPKAKIAMYCKQLEVKKLKESRDTHLKKNFPDIEEWTNDRRGSRIYWNVVSKKKWDDGRAGQFQASIGYDPAGYDLMKFKANKNIDGTFTMKWECSSSSD